MALPELLKKSVELKMQKYCEKKFPKKLQDRVRGGFKIRGDTVTLFEERIGWMLPHKWCAIPVAQFRYDAKDKTWTLYQADRNSRWDLYLDAESTTNLDDLLKEVDKDPTGIFWG